MPRKTKARGCELKYALTGPPGNHNTTIEVAKGESILADVASIACFYGDIVVEAASRPARKVTATSNTSVVLSPMQPGDIHPFKSTGSVRIAKGALLAAPMGTAVETVSQDGMAFTIVRSPGDVLVAASGLAAAHEVPPGAALTVTADRFFACEASTQLQVLQLAGRPAVRLFGPCKAWTQARPQTARHPGVLKDKANRVTFAGP